MYLVISSRYKFDEKLNISIEAKINPGKDDIYVQQKNKVL